jgi:hypothetical protein
MADKPGKPAGQKFNHFGKPYAERLVQLCKNRQFQGRLAALREKWGIEEGHDPERVWKSIVEKDNPQEGDYLDKYERGQTHHQLFKKDLAELASEVGLGRDNWWVLPYVLVSSTSEASTAASGGMPTPRDLRRIDAVEHESHLYLDVTWAGKEDIEEFWGVVKRWQETRRPDHVTKGRLPNQSKNTRPGRS